MKSVKALATHCRIILQIENWHSFTSGWVPALLPYNLPQRCVSAVTFFFLFDQWKRNISPFTPCFLINTVEHFSTCLLEIFIVPLPWIDSCFWKKGWVSRASQRKDAPVIITAEPWGQELQERELEPPETAGRLSSRLLPKPEPGFFTASLQSVFVLNISFVLLRNILIFWEGFHIPLKSVLIPFPETTVHCLLSLGFCSESPISSQCTAVDSLPEFFTIPANQPGAVTAPQPS